MKVFQHRLPHAFFLANASPSEPTGSVAEVQGLYGPFTFTERLLQKIWLRRQFSLEAATVEGKPLSIIDSGRWNLLGGPDFKDAHIQIGDVHLRGDIELHLSSEDWVSHGHEFDPAYDRVVLHVVLFPAPAVRRSAFTYSGRLLPTLVLLPLLKHDLEEYAADEVVETMAGNDGTAALEKLGQIPMGDRGPLLREKAMCRWRKKVHYARKRLDLLGWEEACHHTALEILGYRFNRLPMLKIASMVMLHRWTELEEIDIPLIWALGGREWSMQGVRPANQPGPRLRQYFRWVKAHPRWPAELERLGAGWLGKGSLIDPTGAVRKAHRFGELRRQLSDEVMAHAVSGQRLDTLMCDGFLPLLAAQLGREEEPAFWFHWFPGDFPGRFPFWLGRLGLVERPLQPLCHGLLQGLLGWLIEQERGH
ncbi:MAG TPA: DUF2851 family protein [Opitutaceae bacterium]|nr:DUF2851 family protein [Opitutaceae bacterium]